MKKNALKFPHEILKMDFDFKKQKNRRFSMRAYAKLLGMSNGRLSEILSGKAPITESRAKTIVHKLSLDQEYQTLFLRLVSSDTILRSRLRGSEIKDAKTNLALADFALISDWEYFSLLSLIETSTFRSDPKWIAKKLNISVERTLEVLARLEKLGFIKHRDGKYENTYHSLSTTTGVPSKVLRQANRDCILQGLEKMESVEIHLRDITSITFPVNLEKIKDAKLLIRKFKSQMTKLLGSSPSSEIYNLNIQLVPVSEIGV